jgi:hypothetical protein
VASLGFKRAIPSLCPSLCYSDFLPFGVLMLKSLSKHIILVMLDIIYLMLDLISPDRWLDKHSLASNANLPGVYSRMLSFSGGQHACIGWRFSVLE